MNFELLFFFLLEEFVRLNFSSIFEMRLSYLSEKMLTFFIFWRIVEDIDRRKVINDVSCQRKSRDNIVLTSKHCSTRVEQQLKELKLRLKLDKVFRAELKQPDFTVILFQITRLDDNK